MPASTCEHVQLLFACNQQQDLCLGSRLHAWICCLAFFGTSICRMHCALSVTAAALDMELHCSVLRPWVSMCITTIQWGFPDLQDPLFGGDNVRHGSFTNPTGPPPPYESVITDSASHMLPAASEQAGAAGQPSAAASAANGGSAGGAPAYSSDFEIVVADPVKQGEGVAAYVSYKVCWELCTGLLCLSA